jgi:hypothetical protein
MVIKVELEGLLRMIEKDIQWLMNCFWDSGQKFALMRVLTCSNNLSIKLKALGIPDFNKFIQPKYISIISLYLYIYLSKYTSHSISVQKYWTTTVFNIL